MAHRPVGRKALAATFIALLLPLAACGSDDEPSGTPTGESTPSSDASPSDPASAEPSEDDSASAEAATGPVVELDNAQLNAVDGWEKDRGFGSLQASAGAADHSQSVVLMAIELPSMSAETPVEQLAKIGARTSSVKPKPTILDPVEIGGVEWYHLYSDGGDSNAQHSYGVDHDGYQTTLTFTFDDETVSEDEQQATMDSVLATFTWK